MTNSKGEVHKNGQNQIISTSGTSDKNNCHILALIPVLYLRGLRTKTN